jgi:excisionase family DNA binding protein
MKTESSRSIDNDSKRVIDLTEKDLRDLVSDSVQNAVAEIKSLIITQTLITTKYLSRKETALLLKITLTTLRDWVKSGKIRAHKIGRRVLFKPKEIDEMLGEQLKNVRK